MKTKGFTLVELLVVIAILAILATVSVVGYTSFIKSADESAAMQETHQIETIIDNALIVNTEVYVTLGTETKTYVKLSKDTSGNIIATTVETAPAATAVVLTDDIGAELVAKLTYNNGLVYTYKTGATAETLYPAA